LCCECTLEEAIVLEDEEQKCGDVFLLGAKGRVDGKRGVGRNPGGRPLRAQGHGWAENRQKIAHLKSDPSTTVLLERS
jgi:hypothetical protein